MCPLPLLAAAVAASRTPLRLLGRGLAAAMSAAGRLKSVDYEVFGRVQGRGPPPLQRDVKEALGEEGEKATRSATHLNDPHIPRHTRGGRDFRSAMTQQPRVGKETKRACAGELGCLLQNVHRR